MHLKGLTKLKHLYLEATKVTDAGLVHLKGLSNLEYLKPQPDQDHRRGTRASQGVDQAAGSHTLDPSVVHEAWCHQRNYVCMIHEFGGRPVKAGGHFQAAFIVGYFDSIAEMERVYDRYAGHTGLSVSKTGWKPTR